MDSFKNYSGNRTVHIFITFIAVFLFFIILGFTATASADDVKKDAASGLKGNTVNEWDIIAEVNGKTITTSEILNQYNIYFIMSKFSRTYKEGTTVNSYLDEYISELLLLHKADEMGIRVTGDEAKKEMSRYLKLYRISEDTLLKWLESYGLAMKDAELYLKNRLILRRLYKKISGAGEISDEEAMAYYRKNNEYFNRPAKIQASHILICHTASQGCESRLTRDEAKEIAEKIRKMATPENFAKLAEKYSYDRTGEAGGSLGVITKGTAAPAFEKAAFSLKKGEISDVVETNYGFHIIYVTDKADALSISFEEAKDSIKNTLEEEKVTSKLSKYAEQLEKDAKIKKYKASDRKATVVKPQDQAENNAVPAVKKYATFKPTGKPILRNSKGQPIIMMFTRQGCHFCEWVEGTFDDVVTEYVKKGLIEAHHYDYNTKDDILTPQVETKIPEKFLKLFDFNNPESGTPYFNFGGMYYRAGDGYFQQDDLYAEEMEMRQIIEDLIRYKK